MAKNGECVRGGGDGMDENVGAGMGDCGGGGGGGGGCILLRWQHDGRERERRVMCGYGIICV